MTSFLRINNLCRDKVPDQCDERSWQKREFIYVTAFVRARVRAFIRVNAYLCIQAVGCKQIMVKLIKAKIYWKCVKSYGWLLMTFLVLFFILNCNLLSLRCDLWGRSLGLPFCKCIWNRRLLAGSLCNSRIEESQGIKNKKIGNRRSAWSKQKNDLLSGSFPVANYRSTKGYSKYRNELRDSSDIGIVLLFTIYKKHLSNTNVIITSLFLSRAAYYMAYHMAAHFM